MGEWYSSRSLREDAGTGGRYGNFVSTMKETVKGNHQ